MIEKQSVEEAIDELTRDFTLSTDTVKRMAHHLREEMDLGLVQDGANMPMLPSWICHHPTGQEKGEYIGLELSGTSVRIYLVKLHGQGRITTRQQKYPIHDHLKKGSFNELVDYFAISVDSFLSFVGYQPDHSGTISLGVVLSFPLVQTTLSKASVQKWTKDFMITGAEGKNIVEFLQTSLRRRHIPVTVEAVCNGAVGCLLAHSYRSLDTLLSCTVSTGTNAAYWEKMSNITKCASVCGDGSEGDMIINTEWGSFGDTNPSYLPRTLYDNRVNRESFNPGVHIFEKMVSGLYLGEIARNILVDFADRRLIFETQTSNELNTPYFFEASYMSAIESDDTQELDDTKHILESILNLPTTTLHDRRVVKRICQLVGQRAARLVAAAISAVIDKRNALEAGLTISVEGNIYEHYPNFPNRVNEALRDLYGHNVDRINIGITRDGNGIGGALAAMVARNQQENKE
ncbi:hexokinase-domain-containing protein [Dichotomocladium elegans]|nr:hexokinase-domain-containing protein [Dichotomocladium elegans]